MDPLVIKNTTNVIAQNRVTKELESRGYLVTSLSKKKSDAHLLVETEEGIQFFIKVSGLKKSNFWLIKNSEINDAFYYILVYLPSDVNPKFFVLSSYEMIKERESYRKQIESKSGKYNDDLGGINWKTAFHYEDRWHILPK